MLTVKGTPAGREPTLANSGVDRDQLRYQLSLTPDQRLESLRNAVAFIERQRPLITRRSSP